MNGVAQLVNRMNQRVLAAWVRQGSAAHDGFAPRPLDHRERGALVVYGVTVAIACLALPHLAHPLARVAVALLPLPAALVLVAGSVRRVRQCDELEKHIELAALAIVSTFTWLGLLTVWLLGLAGLHGPSPILWVMAMPAVRGIARRHLRRRYT